MNTVLCLIIICIKEIATFRLPELKKEDEMSALRLINTTSDIIQHTDRQVALLNNIKKTYSENAAFEIGYLTFIIQEKYRRMIDRYNISQTMKKKFYLMEHIMFLEDIEHLYWEIGHVTNMLHEIERKYEIKSPIDEEYDEETIGDSPVGTIPHDYRTRTVTRRRRPKSGFGNVTAAPPKKQNINKWWPIDYGWEIDYYW